MITKEKVHELIEWAEERATSKKRSGRPST